ncbi:MAG: hypothetical protein K2Y22_14755 [Candidatus Obscuribacterales bacterium]|nr:hypothetical protein [Candidatus Obscuribacterales bacterium]
MTSEQADDPEEQILLNAIKEWGKSEEGQRAIREAFEEIFAETKKENAEQRKFRKTLSALLKKRMTI